MPISSRRPPGLRLARRSEDRVTEAQRAAEPYDGPPATSGLSVERELDIEELHVWRISRPSYGSFRVLVDRFIKT